MFLILNVPYCSTIRVQLTRPHCWVSSVHKEFLGNSAAKHHCFHVLFFKVPIKFQSHLQITFIANPFKCPFIFMYISLSCTQRKKIKIQVTVSKHVSLNYKKKQEGKDNRRQNIATFLWGYFFKWKFN